MSKLIPVQQRVIDANHDNQRLDNYLISILSNVPKSLIYKIIRKGEVRVNKKRAKPMQKLSLNDVVRTPPIKIEEKEKIYVSQGLIEELEKKVLVENDEWLVIDKPSGIPVHAGEDVRVGVIEALRYARPEQDFLELVHRLDKETSGCLLIAKNRKALLFLQDLFRHGKIKKTYWALTYGRWEKEQVLIDAAMRKNAEIGGERVVILDENGKSAQTQFTVLKSFNDSTLVSAEPFTGRTHQIRVHAQALGHPLAGDTKYGNKVFNQKLKEHGLNRLFLHAYSLRWDDKHTNKKQEVSVKIPSNLESVLHTLK